MPAFKDLSGQKFGKLTVLERADNQKTQTMYLCQCDCGSKKVVSANNLKSGQIKSCGCLRKEEGAHNFKDITGKKFGRLTVVSRVNNQGTTAYWQCLCECGCYTVTSGAKLRNGHTKSCGCYSRDTARERNTKYRNKSEYHDILYDRWCGMKRRCYNSNCESYKDYGGREKNPIGIREPWLSDFEHFENWSINNGFSPELEIDRIDNDSDYYPENCHWVTGEVNMNNTRVNRWLEYDGKRQTVAQWSRELGIPYHAVLNRLDRSNLPIKKSLTVGVLPVGHQIEFDGKKKNIKEWSDETGIPYSTLSMRLSSGWSIERALTEDVGRILKLNGIEKRLYEWSKETGIAVNTILRRIDKLGWSVDDALIRPLRNDKNQITHNGKTQNLYGWSKELDIGITTLIYRMKEKGMTFDEAINTPIRRKKSPQQPPKQTTTKEP